MSKIKQSKTRAVNHTIQQHESEQQKSQKSLEVAPLESRSGWDRGFDIRLVALLDTETWHVDYCDKNKLKKKNQTTREGLTLSSFVHI